MARPRNQRLAGFLSYFFVACAAIALLVWFGINGRSWLMTSRAFALEKFEFTGLVRAQERELMALGEMEPGDSYFGVDLDLAERGMSQHPWVKQVSVTRSFPKTIRVQVHEYEPVALADLGGLYYIDADGKVFKKLVAGESADLPVLSGISRDEFSSGGDEVESYFQGALEALAAYRKAGLDEKERVSQIAIEPWEGITFFCGSEAFAVKLGFGEYEAKIGRLVTLYQELAHRGDRPEVIRLDNRVRPDWVTVEIVQGHREERHGQD